MEGHMLRLVSVFMVVALLSGCGPSKLSPADIASEKQAIESLVNDFWKAYDTKDLAATTKVFSNSGELMFFGTDSAEVIRNIAEWESQAKNDWELFQSVKFGQMKNVSTVVSSDGELGSIVCEMPADLTIGGEQTHVLFRFAGTMRKEQAEWRLVQGMVAMATVGQSSAELVAKMNQEKPSATGK